MLLDTSGKTSESATGAGNCLPGGPDSAKDNTKADAARRIRVPYRSFGATAGQAGATPTSRIRIGASALADGGEGPVPPSGDAFAAWARSRNHRLHHLAANKGLQPAALPPVPDLDATRINNRSRSNGLLNSQRHAGSDAPDAATSLFSVAGRRPVDAGALPSLRRGVAQHPWVSAPALPRLSRRSFPSLVTLMILIWAAVLAAGIYKGMKPPSGFILTVDR